MLQSILKENSEKNFEKIFDEKNNVWRINLHMPEFEIFKCRHNDLVKADNIKLLKKRSIIEPISFLYNTKKYESLNIDKKKTCGISTVLSLTNSTLKLSYKDFIELFKTVNYQIEVLNKYKNQSFMGLKLKKNEELLKVSLN